MKELHAAPPSTVKHSVPAFPAPPARLTPVIESTFGLPGLSNATFPSGMGLPFTVTDLIDLAQDAVRKSGIRFQLCGYDRFGEQMN